MNNIEEYQNKKTKRLKESKFTEIRNPYKKYLKAKWNWDSIFSEIDIINEIETKFMKIISAKYGINIKTLGNNIL